MRRPSQLTALRRLCRPQPSIHKRYFHDPAVLPSLISPLSPEFVAKKDAMDAVVRDLDAKLAQARAGGGQKAIDRMRSKGKLPPRER